MWQHFPYTQLIWPMAKSCFTSQAAIPAISPPKRQVLTRPLLRAALRCQRPSAYCIPQTLRLTLKPALALGGWAGFIKSGDTAVTYGDLVLLEDELNPVISKLEERGLEVSALHNHLFPPLSPISGLLTLTALSLLD